MIYRIKKGKYKQRYIKKTIISKENNRCFIIEPIKNSQSNMTR